MKITEENDLVLFYDLMEIPNCIFKMRWDGMTKIRSTQHWQLLRIC